MISRLPQRHPPKAVLLTCWLLAFAALGSASAGAQTRTDPPPQAAPAPSPSTDAQQRTGPKQSASPLQASLVQFPSSVGPQDVLRIGLEVTNQGQTPVGDLRVAFSIYEEAATRSQLESFFTGGRRTLLGSDTLPVEGTLAPKQTRTIVVEKPLSELTAVRFSPEDGAYPVRIVLRADREVSNQIDTAMIFFSAPPLQPLGITLAVPLHHPSIYSDGARPHLVTTGSLATSLSSGRLARILTALEKYPEVPVAVAPSGLLLDMLEDLSNGYERSLNGKVSRVAPDDPTAQSAATTLARLRLLASRPATRFIPMPYSAASLGALVDGSLDDLAQAQVVETRNRLSPEPGGTLGIRPSEGWLVPVYRSLDELTLSALQRSGVNKVILSESSLREGRGNLTRGAPVQVETRSGPMLALIEDEGLRDALERDEYSKENRRSRPLLTRQRFLADTATIMLERPALKRDVSVVTPLAWDPGEPEVEGILESLASSVWMRGTGLDEVADRLNPSSPARSALAVRQVLQSSIPQPPDPDFFTHLRQARRAIQRFAELAPPAERLSALRKRLLIAQSADWWTSRRSLEKGLAFARHIPPEVDRQTKMIRAPGAQIITLTSRTGVIPLSVGSQLEYPVDVVLRLESDKLQFPEGNRIFIQKLQSPTRTVEVKTIAQATGTFPLRVQVQTSTGTLISEARLTIRSTAYNVMAVAITTGAGLFLFGWWAFGSLKRRVRPAG